MTSQFDLASFTQTVVYVSLVSPPFLCSRLTRRYEDQVNADTIDDDEHGVPRRPVVNEEEEDEVRGRVPRRATQRAKISTRQMAFIGPRQGVLTNSAFRVSLPRDLLTTALQSPLLSHSNRESPSSAKRF